MYEKMKARVNWPVTILLFIGLITVAFPLYMAIVIAFKQPSDMTNSISGILSLPASWSLSNFAQAMELTDFWHSLANSLMVTVVTVVLSIILHSLMGYAVGRNKAHSKWYNFVYLFIVSGMFVPFAILMMPLAKQTAEMHLDNWAGVILLYVVFYMPMNLLLYTGYLVNDVMTPLIIMSGKGQNTLPLAQLTFQTQFGTNYNLAFASYLLALIPIIIFYVICQKQIINGVVNGAVK